MPIQYKACPSCGKKISRSLRQCEECEAKSQKNYNTNRRDKDMQKFYQSKEWRAVRALVLSRNPLCAMCDHPADVVDHVIEIRDGGAKLDINNLRGLCHYHHNKKSAEEKSKRG